MALDGNCLEMADNFTCWAEVQNPLASSLAVSENSVLVIKGRKKKKKKEKSKITFRGEDELTW